MSQKLLDPKEISRRIKEIHGDLITMDESTYKGYAKKATFVHKIYGKWETRARHVLQGRTHRDASNFGKIASIEKLQEKLKETHKGNVILVENTYKGTHKKCVFIHAEYGEWEATPNSVINFGCNHPKIFLDRMTLKKEEVEKRISGVHGDLIHIIWETFIGTHKKCKFIHRIYGEFESTPVSVFAGCGPIAGIADKMKATNLKRYGVEYTSQNMEIAIRIAKSQTKSAIKTHWRTNQDLVCQASWEPKIIDYLNINKINYLWQPQIFKIPNGKTYRPDLYLEDEDKWVEIKGYFRKDALEKWDWFQSQYPNSELWDKKKLKEMGIL